MSSFLPDSLVWFIGLFSPHSFLSQGKNLNGGTVKSSVGDFPDGSVFRTPCAHCRASGFDPWSGS